MAGRASWRDQGGDLWRRCAGNRKRTGTTRSYRCVRQTRAVEPAAGRIRRAASWTGYRHRLGCGLDRHSGSTGRSPLAIWSLIFGPLRALAGSGGTYLAIDSRTHVHRVSDVRALATGRCSAWSSGGRSFCARERQGGATRGIHSFGTYALRGVVRPQRRRQPIQRHHPRTSPTRRRF